MGAVVVTDPASADADWDNGAALQRRAYASRCKVGWRSISLVSMGEPLMDSSVLPLPCAAVRRLIPSMPRPCSLVPTVTRPLYSTTASQALRQKLRKSFSARVGQTSQVTSLHHNAYSVSLYSVMSLLIAKY